MSTKSFDLGNVCICVGTSLSSPLTVFCSEKGTNKRQDLKEKKLFSSQPSESRVIGSLIASTGNLAGIAAPVHSQLQPNVKRPGYRLSRLDSSRLTLFPLFVEKLSVQIFLQGGACPSSTSGATSEFLPQRHGEWEIHPRLAALPRHAKSIQQHAFVQEDASAVL